MGLTGEAKKEYQRAYMERRRSNKGVTGSNKAVESGVRVNPHTGKGYGVLMAGMPPEVLDEYERKMTRKNVLVVAELPQSKRDELYKGLQQVYRSRERC